MTKAERRVLDLRSQYEAALEKLHDAFAQKLARANVALRRQRGGCSHPAEAHIKFEWEWDNGYGRQKMQAGLRCRLCGAENNWPATSTIWS